MFRPINALLLAVSLLFGHSTLSAQTIVTGQAACCAPAQAAVSAPTYSGYAPVTTHYAPTVATATPVVAYYPQTPIAAPVAVTTSAPVVTYSPVVTAAPTTTYYAAAPQAAPVVTYSPVASQPVVAYSPVVAYRPRHQAVGIVTSPGHYVMSSAYYSAPLPTYAAQPVVTGYAPTTFAAPTVVAAPVAVPTVAAYPVMAVPTRRFFVPGQPVRNVYRAIVP